MFLAGGQGQLKTAIQNTKGNTMKLFLAGTNRLNTDMKKAESGGLMKAYLAESGGLLFRDAYILQSYYYVDDFTEKVVIPNCKDFILDSGAFTFIQNSKKAVNWDEYTERYADFIKRNKVKKYFELDIDSLVGIKEVERLRTKLESLVGYQSIPVWHRGRGIEYWKKMCKEYSYVAVGGIAIKEIKRNEYPIFTKLIKIAHSNGTKVHGLGFTSMDGIKKYHFDSVDSSSWVTGNRFGQVFKFENGKMTKISKPNGKKIKSNIVAIHNFCEWKKFSKYAERMY